MNILFLVPYPLKESPSQRFRFEQYFDILLREGHAFHVQSFLESHNWRKFSKPGKMLSKGCTVVKGFGRRLRILSTLSSYDVVFIHRETSPVGPPILEWVISRVFGKRIIYDFDDAIWLTDQERESFLPRLIKWRTKVGSICRWSYKVSCGNDFLCAYASRFNKNVILNPTTVDTANMHRPRIAPRQNTGEIIIGWTGSYTTLKYLNLIEDTLREIETRYAHVKFLVISDRPSSLKLNALIFEPWTIDTEIEALNRIDIGIMPLPEDEWSRGKCGLKALQYMALEIPTIASGVGANITIIDHAVNGFLATTQEDWMNYLVVLIENAALRKDMGKKGRQKVIDQFSVRSNTSTFLSLFA